MKKNNGSFKKQPIEAVEDGEVVIIDSGCGEVVEMIKSCGVENVENFAGAYEKKALEIAEKEGWEIVEVNNCNAVKFPL